MTYVQAADIMNEGFHQLIGEENVAEKDLSNVIDIGRRYLDLNTTDRNHMMEFMIDRLARTYYNDRKLNMTAPNILREDWEYEAIVRKINIAMPDLIENATWQLEAGQSVDPFVVHAVGAQVRYWNIESGWEVDVTVYDRQLRSAFTSAADLARFWSAVEQQVRNRITASINNMILDLHCTMIGETLYDAYESEDTFNTGSTPRVINLLYNYNKQFETELDKFSCWFNLDFLKYFACTMKDYMDFISGMNVNFNMSGLPRWTERQNMHIVMLAEVKNKIETYLQSSIWHEQFTEFPKMETVVQWQGPGAGIPGFAQTSKIDVDIPSGHHVSTDGVVGCIYDRDALALCCLDQRTTTQPNGKGEYTNYFHKADMKGLASPDENFVVLIVA